jgi:hypothetical protein
MEGYNEALKGNGQTKEEIVPLEGVKGPKKIGLRGSLYIPEKRRVVYLAVPRSMSPGPNSATPLILCP